MFPNDYRACSHIFVDQNIDLQINLSFRLVRMTCDELSES